MGGLAQGTGCHLESQPLVFWGRKGVRVQRPLWRAGRLHFLHLPRALGADGPPAGPHSTQGSLTVRPCPASFKLCGRLFAAVSICVPLVLVCLCWL